ncbi:MAG: sigma-70 family RNA polymerase sigma factor [Cytophagales bacterium]|nr:sigma-70 family RNA polymerase sigma factor [Cytophagales bacterium]
MLFVPIQEQAEDVVSAVLIKLLKKEKNFFEAEKFEGYLFMAIKNQSISFLREQKIKYANKSLDFEKDHIWDEYDPEKSMEFDELTKLVTKTINGLPPRRQMIFKMVKEENQKIKNVAALLDISPKTVENHLSLAVRELRQTIQTYLDSGSSQANIFKLIKTLGPIVGFFSMLNS